MARFARRFKWSKSGGHKIILVYFNHFLAPDTKALLFTEGGNVPNHLSNILQNLLGKGTYGGPQNCVVVGRPHTAANLPTVTVQVRELSFKTGIRAAGLSATK